MIHIYQAIKHLYKVRCRVTAMVMSRENTYHCVLLVNYRSLMVAVNRLWLRIQLAKKETFIFPS